MSNKIFLKLILIFALAYVLRILFLPQNAITFGYDQARDALVTQKIISGDLKILGPPASTPGLYHGAFYNYTLIPAYILFKGTLLTNWTTGRITPLAGRRKVSISPGAKNQTPAAASCSRA